MGHDGGVSTAEQASSGPTAAELEGAAGRSPGGPRPGADGSRWLLALAGALAGAAGVALSEATAQALRVDIGPIEGVASAVRDLTPGPIALFLVHLVGTLDKPLLLLGTALILLGICAYAASWVRRFPLLPDVVFFVLGAIGLVAVLRLPSPGLGAGLAIVVGLITWIVTLRALTAPLLRETHPDEPRSDAATRREFLIRSAWLVGVVAVLTIGGRAAGSARRQVEQARRLLRLPVRSGRVPAGAALDVEGLSPWRTPNRDFYVIHTALAPPSVKPEEWSLRIHGMVDQEVTIDYEGLLSRELAEDWLTLCCVSNQVGGDLIGNAWWSGVLVRDLLAEAGVQPGADAVKQTSRDGWTCGTPLVALTDERNAMLAVAMNGEPLPVEHGFPVRMVVPGLYGYVSATKWLEDLEVTRFDAFDSFWTERGWSERGPIKTQSRVEVPRNGAKVRAGKVTLAGTAWAQHTGIAKVEYQLDGRPWREAELGRVPHLDTWVQWTAEEEVGPGEHRVTVRATDRSGYTQTAVRTDVVPDGATGWHSHPFDAE